MDSPISSDILTLTLIKGMRAHLKSHCCSGRTDLQVWSLYCRQRRQMCLYRIYDTTGTTNIQIINVMYLHDIFSMFWWKILSSLSTEVSHLWFLGADPPPKIKWHNGILAALHCPALPGDSETRTTTKWWVCNCMEGGGAEGALPPSSAYCD